MKEHMKCSKIYHVQIHRYLLANHTRINPTKAIIDYLRGLSSVMQYLIIFMDNKLKYSAANTTMIDNDTTYATIVFDF